MQFALRFLVAGVLMGLVLYGTITLTFQLTSSYQIHHLTSKAIQVEGEGASVRSVEHVHKPIRPNMTPMQRHVNRECEKHSHLASSSSKITPEMVKNFIVDDKHKIIYCPIPKVACTTWKRMFIVLTGKSGTSDPMSFLGNDVHHKYSSLLTYLGDLPNHEIQRRLKTYFKFTIVREPFERILSAFKNKFDGRKSQANNYFQDSVGRKIIRNYRGGMAGVSNNNITNPRITFSEFIDYLIDSNSPISSNEHWDKFHKLCHPCAIDYNFIGKLESIQADSEHILEKTGLKSVIKFPTRQESRYRHKETNKLLMQYYSGVSKSRIRHLWGAYREDFDIFNYSVPIDLKKLM